MSGDTGDPWDQCVRSHEPHLADEGQPEESGSQDARVRALRTAGVSSKEAVRTAVWRFPEIAWSAVGIVCAALALGVTINAFDPPAAQGFTSAPAVTYAHLVSRWTSFGNDRLGDCTVAAEAELVEVWDAVVHRSVALRKLDAAVMRRWRAVHSMPYLWTTTAYWETHPIVGVWPVAWREFPVTRHRELKVAVQQPGAVEVSPRSPPRRCAKQSHDAAPSAPSSEVGCDVP